MEIVKYFVVQNRESVVLFCQITVNAVDNCSERRRLVLCRFSFVYRQNEIVYNRLKFFRRNVLYLSVLRTVVNCKKFLEKSDIVYRLFCYVFVLIISSSLKSTNLELEAICKTAKKAGNVMSLLSVTYGKYATQVPDVMSY